MASPSSPPWTRLLGDHGLRASDAEREWVIDRLRVHTGEGRLTPDELGERIDLAYGSKTRGDLVRLLRDLPEKMPASGAVVARPAPAPSPRRRRRAPRWAPLVLVFVVWVGLAGGPGGGHARDAGRESATAAALRSAGQGSEVVDVDRRWDGWEVDVRRADGSRVEVEVDDEGNVVDVDSD